MMLILFKIIFKNKIFQDKVDIKNIFNGYDKRIY